MNRRTFSLLAGLALAASSAASFAQTSWDAVGDFSLTSNPGSAWSYHWQSPGGALQPLPFSTVVDPVGLSGWSRFGSSFNFPLVGINTTASSIEFASSVLPLSVLDLHPGPSNDRAVVAWTAPSTGTYVITGLFQLIDRQPTGVQVLVRQSSTTLLNKPLTAFADSTSFRFVRSVTAGQKVTFSVDANGDYANDSTALKVGILKLP